MQDIEQIIMNETSPDTEQKKRTCETCNMKAQGGYLNCEYMCAYKVKKLKDDLVCKTQEYEELKEENKRLVGIIANFIFDDFEELDRYRKALEEIEKVAKGMCSIFIEEISITASQLNDRIYRKTSKKFRQILDIISKAKWEGYWNNDK